MTLLKKFIALIFVVFFVVGCGSKTKEEMLQEGISLTEKGNVTGGIILFRNALEKDPNYFEARFHLAKGYITVGKYDQAERELEKVKRQDPGNTEIDLLLAKVFVETERYDQALEKIRDYLAVQPPTAEALVIQGRAYLVKNEYASAMDAFSRAKELDSNHLDAYLGMASVYMAQRQVEQALPVLKTATELHPTDKRAFQLIASIITSQGQLDEALVAWKKVLEIDAGDAPALYQVGLLSITNGDIEAGSKYGEDLIRRYSNQPQGYQLRGLVHYHYQKWEEAAEAFQRSLSFGSNLQSHYYYGLSLFRLGRYELALGEFNRALDFNPDFTPARIMNASTLLIQERIDAAIFQAQTAVVSDPRNAWAHNVLGSALIMKGRHEEGMASFEQAVRLDPSLSTVHMKKGAISLSRGDVAGAEAAMIDAVQANPDVLGSRFALTLLQVRQGQIDKGIETLKAGLADREQDAFLYYQMATLQFRQERFDDAVQSLEQSKQAKSDFLAPYFALGVYHLAKADLPKAMAEYQGILKIEPENFQALVMLANIQEQAGQRKESTDSFQKAISVDAVRGSLAYAYQLMRREDHAQALKVLNEGLAKASDNPLLLEMRGKLHASRNDYPAAIADFRKISEQDQDKGLPLLVQHLVQAGQVDEAISQAQALIDKNPESPGGYQLMSAIYMATGNVTEALASLDRGLAKVKDVRTLTMNKATVLRAQGQTDMALALYENLTVEHNTFFPALYAQASIHHQQGRYRDAQRLYREVIDINPNFVPALNDLAYLLIDRMNQPKDGLDLAMQAFRLSPTEPAVMDTLGYALYRNGESDRAVRLLESAAKGLPESGTVLYHLASVYADLGQNESAVQTLQQAMDKATFPEQDKAKELLNRLSN